MMIRGIEYAQNLANNKISPFVPGIFYDQNKSRAFE